MSVATDKGCKLELQLAEEQVFEDLTPRLIQMVKGQPIEVLAIVSLRSDGSGWRGWLPDVMDLKSVRNRWPWAHRTAG